MSNVKKPGCFTQYNPSWSVCTDKCAVRKQCRLEKEKIYGHDARNWRKSPKPGWGASAAEEALKFNEAASRREQGKTYDTEAYGGLTDSRRTTNQKRIFHMPAAPLVKIMWAAMEPNTAIMFGLWQYRVSIKLMQPSDIADEYDRIIQEENMVLKNERMKILRELVLKYWNTWDEFMRFCKQ